MRVTQPELLELFYKYMDSKGKQAKLKSPNQLQELLDITRSLLQVHTGLACRLHAQLCLILAAVLQVRLFQVAAMLATDSM